MILFKMKNVARFSLEPVGQGLFYTGMMGNFNMVYDCGELNGPAKIAKVVSEYKKNLGNKKIDMLILSHLHWDHVCGLEELMKNTCVRYVFLPYLLPIHRLILALKAPVEANQSYYSFLIDPVNYLINLGVEKVILVGGEKGEDNSGRFEPNDYSTRDEELDINGEDLNEESILLPDDEGLKAKVKENDDQLFNSEINNRLSFKNHSGLISLKGKWYFRFFAPPTKTNLKNFENCVENIIPGSRKINSETLSRILSKPQDLVKIKTCYANTFKNLNDTSLIVFHGPYRKLSSVFCFSNLSKDKTLNATFYLPSQTDQYKVRFGWLLTGDVDFNKVSIEFLNHFSSCLSYMTYLLIPHHGAKRNWNSIIINRVAKPSQWFVSFGLGNKYHHPNYGIIQEIVKHGNSVSISNEIMRVDQHVF